MRKYVESAYVKSSSEKINASKMTTEEFLRSAEGSPYFPEKALAMLRGFLQDADRVKFAGARTTREKSYDASATARGYVATWHADAIPTASTTVALDAVTAADSKGYYLRKTDEGLKLHKKTGLIISIK